MTALADLSPSRPRTELAPLLRAGLIAGVLLFGGLGGWAALAPIGGAVIAQGALRVEGRPRPLQSPDGGLVAAVAVTEGQHVAAGQVILTFDPALATARVEVARARLAGVLAERARLLAEAAGAAEPAFVVPALPFAPPDMADAVAGQRTLFAARAARAADARRRLAETEAQIAAQTRGVEAQIAAIRAEAGLLGGEIAVQADLLGKGLARQGPLSELRRQEAALAGRLAEAEAERARLAAASREAQLALADEEGARAEEVARGLRDTAAQVAELTQEILGLEATLARTELRAPLAGVIHELAVAPGTVAAPGDLLAQIVPLERGVEIEVRIDPRAIDQVHPGQPAEVVISAFDPRAVPRLAATVAVVPPGAVTDPATGQGFYRVTLSLPESEIARLGAVTLTPGMPVEAYLATGERSALAWLAAPLLAPLRHALRED